MVPAKVTMTDEKKNPESESRNVDGLTEVLRLQAEALSRISERMSGMRGNSPGAAPLNPPPVSPGKDLGQGHNLPVLAGDPALNEDSLPVLNSFKKFLDQERRQARKRILWVLLGITVAFSAVLAVIVWLNTEHVSALKSDILLEKVTAEKSRQQANAEIRKVSEGAALSATQNANTMRKDITRNILWAHSVISSNLSSELSGRDSEIDQLKDKVSALEIENTMLTKQLNELGRRMKAVEDDYRDFLERPLLETQLRDAETAVEADPSNRPPAASRVTNPLMINSARLGRTLQLQMPKE